MAPYRKMKPKEIKLEQMPWITLWLLVSMRVRDTLYKCWRGEKDFEFKCQIFTLYNKRYRNMIVSLLRKSKGNYYSLFLQNQSDVKKYGMT